MKHPFDCLDVLKSELKKWNPGKNPKIVGYSKSPMVTGQAGHFNIGRTKSGKAIYSHPEHPGHKGFTAADHSDAYYAHKKHLSSLKDISPKPHPGLVQHHESSMAYHRKKVI